MRFIPISEPVIGEEELLNATDCIKSTWISSLGKYITEFENNFSSYCQVKYGVCVANGTLALQLALKSLNIGNGDEVIIPNLTFVATANAVTYLGSKPVPVDCEAETWNIDPFKIEKAVTDKTKAIIPVHLYGHPCDMDPIMKIAGKYNLKIIEDAAEAHGSEYKGRKVGSIGHIGCFSFYGNKTITTGEGGMCITNDKTLSDKMRFLKDHGMSKKKRYWHQEIGYNFRMTNIQASIGCAQLKKIDKFIEIKRKNAFLYNSILKDCDKIILPPEKEWSKNTYWLYSILLKDNNIDYLITKLRGKNIDSRRFFYPINVLPPYKQKGDFKVSNKLSKMGISLPSSVNLTEEEIKYICQTLLEIMSGLNGNCSSATRRF